MNIFSWAKPFSFPATPEATFLLEESRGMPWLWFFITSQKRLGVAFFRLKMKSWGETLLLSPALAHLWEAVQALLVPVPWEGQVLGTWIPECYRGKRKGSRWGHFPQVWSRKAGCCQVLGKYGKEELGVIPRPFCWSWSRSLSGVLGQPWWVLSSFRLKE